MRSGIKSWERKKLDALIADGMPAEEISRLLDVKLECIKTFFPKPKRRYRRKVKPDV